MANDSNLRRHLPSTGFVLIALVLVGVAAGAFILSGIYNIGADAPHSKIVATAMRDLRDNAIAHHSRNIAVPADLSDPKRIEAGAGLYKEMCTGCHLGPGVEPSELSQGLYPPAPLLAETSDRSPQAQFWIVKHGVKFSAMPAWGKTHSDGLIWDMVAFIRQLPRMSVSQYQAALANAPEDHDSMMKTMAGADGDSGKHDTASSPHSHPGEDAPSHGD